MNNPFDEITEAVRQAENLFRSVDQTAYKMARLLRGRMRQVDDIETLRTLKQELQHFDARSGEWKDQKK